jgi:hypothetical protein
LDLKNKGFFVLASMLCLPALMQASDIYITTGQTGAQTQMDLNHDSVFAATSLSLTCGLTDCATAVISFFDPTFDWDLAGGDFTMKDGSATSADVTFSFYDNVSGLLSSVDYDYTQFCAAHGGNCQSFDSTKFTFAGGPITLLAGHHYYGTITTNAADEQSAAYFIKGLDSVGFTPNAPTAPTNDPPTNNPPTTSAVPEPGSVLLMLGGAIGLAFTKRK